MKLAPSDHRHGLTPPRVLVALCLCALLPLLAYAAAPAWWAERGVTIASATPDDYAPANQGQLKNIATAALAELDAKLPGGAGDALHSLIGSWSTPGAQTDDFALVNVGQLKNVAKPFYDRLAAAGSGSDFPWPVAPRPADDFAIANIGQLKALFSFDLADPAPPTFGDRVAAGQSSAAVALDNRGSLWTWGHMAGDGTNVFRRYPARLAGMGGIMSVAAGDHHIAVLRTDGGVWTWGRNAFGELGDGTQEARSIAAPVPNLMNVVSIKAGGAHNLALLDDGTVLAWGDNYYGPLGVDDIESSAVPVPVTGLTDVRSIAAGSSHSLAIKNDGTLWAWGYSHYNWGQEIWSATPTLVAGLEQVIDVAAGYEHVVAVKSDGSVWAWGSSYSHQLGTGMLQWTFQATPVPVPNLANVTKVAANGDHTLALLADGTVWGWGRNSFGQLGDGTTQTRATPVMVTGLTDVVAIATTWSYSMAMKSDGSLWAWGYGAPGVLPGADMHVPQPVTLGLLDTNQNGIDDRWELEHFGNLEQTADGDFDGDGIPNFQEIRQGSDPADYFNGQRPVIEIVSGNNQIGDPGTFAAQALTVRVRTATGGIMVNAPVVFAVSSGNGELALSRGELPQGPSLSLRTSATGEASVYYLFSGNPGESSRIAASTGTVPNDASATFREYGRYIPAPPPPTPTPAPGSSPGPSPTPAPTATPTAPYRYAIVDLGKHVQPRRITKSGWVLLTGYDPEIGSTIYRWKGGNAERLTFNGQDVPVYGADINDHGTVVGTVYDTVVDEPAVGVVWLPGSPAGNKVSAHAVLDEGGYFSRTIKYASCSAVTDANQVFGEMYTGEKFLAFSEYFSMYHGFIKNSCRWSTDGTLAQVISDGRNVPAPYGGGTMWTGRMDSILRANSDGRYVGYSLVATGDHINFIGIPAAIARWTPMIDGNPVSFDPVDINESGIVVGSNSSGMVIRAGNAETAVSGYPVAINDHRRETIGANGRKTTTSAPQVLAWDGSATVLWQRLEDEQTWHPFGLEEMIPNMDGWEISDINDINDNGVIVGAAGFKDPTNPYAETEWHGYMLVPVEIVPDFNRDGVIDDTDGGKVTEAEPWRWWLNDDDDSGEVRQNDVPGAGPDSKDSGVGPLEVDGSCDLLDFFPLYLRIKSLVELLPPEQAEYHLLHENEAVNFVYTDLLAAETGGYLRGATTADQLKNASSHRSRLNGQGRLSNEFMNKIKREDGKGVLLLEGSNPSDKPLRLEVWKGGRKLAEVKLPMNVDGVETMYRWINLRGVANGGVVGRATDTTEPSNRPDRLTTDKHFVFVHGYNVSEDSARGWNAEIFKRLYQSGLRAKFTALVWRGNQGQLSHASITPDYWENVTNAFITSPHVTAAVHTLPGTKVIAAHSLGNMVVASAIKDHGLDVSQYFQVDAAVAVQAYDQTMENKDKMRHPEWQGATLGYYPEYLWSAYWHTLFPEGDGRRMLTWRHRFGPIPNAHNYYSTGEEVLNNSDGTVPESGVEKVWALQELVKGTDHIGATVTLDSQGGWGFNQAWFIEQTVDPGGQSPPETIRRRRRPNEVSDISADQVKTKPFFGRFQDHRLMDAAQGSAAAGEYHTRAKTLAEGIPSLSFAAGRNSIINYQDSNTDMMALKTGWPPERLNDPKMVMSNGEGRWLHSDVGDVAYRYVYRIFNQWVEDGDLK